MLLLLLVVVAVMVIWRVCCRCSHLGATRSVAVKPLSRVMSATIGRRLQLYVCRQWQKDPCTRSLRKWRTWNCSGTVHFFSDWPSGEYWWERLTDLRLSSVVQADRGCRRKHCSISVIARWYGAVLCDQLQSFGICSNSQNHPQTKFNATRNCPFASMFPI